MKNPLLEIHTHVTQLCTEEPQQPHITLKYKVTNEVIDCIDMIKQHI